MLGTGRYENRGGWVGRNTDALSKAHKRFILAKITFLILQAVCGDHKAL